MAAGARHPPGAYPPVLLTDLKRDKQMLLAVLGGKMDRGGKMLCPFHAEDTASLHVFQAANAVWLFKCFGCGESGSILDAAMKQWGIDRLDRALQAIEGRLGVRIDRDVEYDEPIIDQERAELMIGRTHERLMGNFDLQERYMLGKRGITSYDLARKYRLGFMVDQRVTEWQSWRLTGWILPITNAAGQVIALKFHREERITSARGRVKAQPKCMWIPLGTVPSAKPKHGTSTLWPPPEQWGELDQLVIAPGELKALALENAGLKATSPTAGEGGRFPRRLAQRIARCRPGEIVINYDDDDAGRSWADAVQLALDAENLYALQVKFSLDRPPEPPLRPPPVRGGLGEGSEGDGGLTPIEAPPGRQNSRGLETCSCGSSHFWRPLRPAERHPEHDFGPEGFRCCTCSPIASLAQRREIVRVEGPMMVKTRVEG